MKIYDPFKKKWIPLTSRRGKNVIQGYVLHILRGGAPSNMDNSDNDNIARRTSPPPDPSPSLVARYPRGDTVTAPLGGRVQPFNPHYQPETNSWVVARKNRNEWEKEGDFQRRLAQKRSTYGAVPYGNSPSTFDERMEGYTADAALQRLRARHANVVKQSNARDAKWKELYQRYPPELMNEVKKLTDDPFIALGIIHEKTCPDCKIVDAGLPLLTRSGAPR